MKTKTGVQVIGKLLIFLFITYLIALGIYTGTHGIDGLQALVKKENTTNSLR